MYFLVLLNFLANARDNKDLTLKNIYDIDKYNQQSVTLFVTLRLIANRSHEFIDYDEVNSSFFVG